MKAVMSEGREQVTLQRLLWAAGCCALATFANLQSLPLWILATAFAAGGIRIVLARRGSGPPPPIVLVPVAALVIFGLLLKFHTFNGITAGTALLCLMAGLKLLETRRLRDIHVIVLIVYFLCLAALLHSESFWLLIYVIGVCWLATATLVQLTVTAPAPPWRRSLRHATRMLAHALPLALFLWLLFPRLAEPLWQVRDESASATTGLSDTMDPGDLSNLVLNDDIAFRAHFTSAAPAVRNRYWRGPVLEEFDGRTWRRNDRPNYSSAAAETAPATDLLYAYTIGLEPYPHNWIYALDRPVHWDLEHARLSDSGVLERRDPISQPIDVAMTSIAGATTPGILVPYKRARDLALPPGRNPRTAELARQMRLAHPDARDYARSVLGMLHDQAFFYVLTPPRLGENSVDDFLFDARRGFCGHYASAFAVMMRAAGIPARVVTGYLGGMVNPYSDYWIVRQSDAHAWVEIWIEGSGWLRIDPTAAIASTRVEQQGAEVNVNALLGIDLHLHGSWLANIGLRVDALRQIWRKRILQFDQSAQQSLLQQLSVPLPDTGKFALLLALCVGSAFAWMSWQVRRDHGAPSRDLVVRSFDRLCERLGKVGFKREPHEGAEAFAERVARIRPDLGAGLRALMREYSGVRYGDSMDRAAIKRLVHAMRGFPIGREP